jgi:hypothetical protein
MPAQEPEVRNEAAAGRKNIEDNLPEALKAYIKKRERDDVHYSFAYKLTWLRGFLSIFGAFLPLLFRTYLIPKGEIGLVMDNGEPKIISPGWHIFLVHLFRSRVA